jgi:hypothetical protein
MYKFASLNVTIKYVKYEISTTFYVHKSIGLQIDSKEGHILMAMPEIKRLPIKKE